MPIETRRAVHGTPQHKKARPQVEYHSKTVAKVRPLKNKRLPDEESENGTHKETVGVFLRLRRVDQDEPTLVKLSDQQIQTNPPDDKSGSQIFSFTKVFENVTQADMFDNVARPVNEQFITECKDGLIFTYGITGSGKTYTMEGIPSDPGLVYRSIDFVFNSIGDKLTPKGLIRSNRDNSFTMQEHFYPDLNSDAFHILPSEYKWMNRDKDVGSVKVDKHHRYCLFISLIELYNNQVHDLFDGLDNECLERTKKRREIRSDTDDKSYVANATELEVRSADEAVRKYNEGVKRRRTGATALNQESSRGHCVFSMKLVQATVHHEDSNRYVDDYLRSSQLCLVDLAGSERIKRSGVTGGAAHEAGKINNSLGALRMCIRALRDRDDSTNVNFRDYSLTKLFKSYLQGHGTVKMILCVKPTREDFQENLFAMDFGVLTQDVAIDYASPAKMLKRSKSRTNIDHMGREEWEKLHDLFDHNKVMDRGVDIDPDCSDEEFFARWETRLKQNQSRRHRCIRAVQDAQYAVREKILKTWRENQDLTREIADKTKKLQKRDEDLKKLTSEMNYKERSKENFKKQLEDLRLQFSSKDRKIKELQQKKKELDMFRHENEKLRQAVSSLIETDVDRHEICRRLIQMINEKPLCDANMRSPSKPSAPCLEPMISSSPVKLGRQQQHSPTTITSTETGSSQSSASKTTSSTSMHPMETVPKQVTTSPLNLSGGQPLVNPRHNRSLSCSNMYWIHHMPKTTIDTGTVLAPKLKNGRSVRNLRSSDLLRKDAGAYSIVHQDADSNGEVETSVYKGQIISTVCGGAQVVINDIETMKQKSPKRKRAVSDAHYTK